MNSVTCGNFRSAFAANMNALGLPSPSSLFGTLETATSNITAMLHALKTLGPSATVAELIGATTTLEALSVAGALSAAFYVGACIGSLIVATKAAITCGTSSAAVTARIATARLGLVVPESMLAFIRRHPEVLTNRPARRHYACLALHRAELV
ncbi:hypothetical protein [Paraburkholderia tuberum]|uniref:Uncharacterized protein n=1 Tax=Paraburkholderia tuberum TaxID=157910 RepID=A0A1H1JMR5_9BURK|nr:hypothetical protein [Paraburkholderia tuberum]SDR51308.1 hypothetical protein SAMN05445850_5236 [Paraburkholderia tuberum]